MTSFLFHLLLVISSCVLPSFADQLACTSSCEKLPVETYHWQDCRLIDMDVHQDTIFIYSQKDYEKVIWIVEPSGVRKYAYDKLQNIHDVVYNFFKTDNAYHIIQNKFIDTNKGRNKQLLVFNNFLNAVDTTEFADDAMIFGITKTINTGEYFYYNVITFMSDTDTCKIYRANDHAKIFQHNFLMPPLPRRSPVYLFDVIKPFVALASDSEYKLRIHNFIENKTVLFTPLGYKNEKYSKKELGLLSPNQAFFAETRAPIPPALKAVHFINENTIAVIRHPRPGQTKLAIDFVSTTAELLKTERIDFNGHTFKLSCNALGVIYIISKKENEFFLHSIRVQ